MSSRRIAARSGSVTALIAGASLALMLGCGAGKEPAQVAEEKPATEAAAWQPKGDEGSVTGKINFEGQPPKYKAISMDADTACAAKHSKAVYPEAVVVNANGTLRNVLVYVKGGLEGKTFAVPGQPAVLDQDGCVYKPHVLGIQARQTLRVVTSDNSTHNIHPIPKVNREWNVSQPPGADPIPQTFSRPESSIPVKCNQHPWMRAYIHVLSHPFYSVSGEEGAFTLKGLPPGNYEIEAVHEQYGALTQQVTVAANKATSADFRFLPGQAYRASSLRMLPALVLPCCGGE